MKWASSSGFFVHYACTPHTRTSRSIARIWHIHLQPQLKVILCHRKEIHCSIIQANANVATQTHADTHTNTTRSCPKAFTWILKDRHTHMHTHTQILIKINTQMYFYSHINTHAYGCQTASSLAVSGPSVSSNCHKGSHIPGCSASTQTNTSWFTIQQCITPMKTLLLVLA